MSSGGSSCDGAGLKTDGSAILFSPSIAITGIKVVSNDNARAVNGVKKGSDISAISTTVELANTPSLTKDCTPKEILFKSVVNAGEFVQISLGGNISIVYIELIPAILPPTLTALPTAISVTTPVGTAVDAANRTVTIAGERLTGDVSLSITPGASGGKFTLPGDAGSITPADGAVDESVALVVDVTTEGVFSDTLVISSAAADNITVKIPLDLTVEAADNTPPQAATYFPAESATDVPVNTEIYVIFDEDVVRSTGEVTIDNGITVSAADMEGAKLVITPATPLVKATTYTVTLAADAVKDLSGNSNAEITWQFTTDASAPTVKTLFPAHGSSNIPATTDIYAVFSEPVTLGSGGVTVDNSITVGAFEVKNDTILRITLDGTTPLQAGVQYTITLAAGVVADVAGNEVAAFSTWQFTVDNTPPAIVSKEPEDGVDVPIKPVKITFNESVKIADTAQILVNGVKTIGASVSGATLTLKDAIKSNATYAVTLGADAITDVSGNAFAGTTWSFTTLDDGIVFPYHPAFVSSYTVPSWMYGTINYKTEDAGCTEIPSEGYVLSVQNEGDTLFIVLPQCGTFTAKVGYTGNNRGLQLFKLGDETPVATVAAPGSGGSSACHTLTYNFNTFDEITLYITLTGSGGRIWDLEITAPVPVPVIETAHFPATDGADMPVDARIYAVFDQPIQLVEGAGEATVGGSAATLSVSEDTLFIAPAELLENDREYTVSVDTNVVTGTANHTAGNAPLSWSFTTVKPAPAQVTIVHHASGADTLRLGATWQLSATVTPSNAISQTLSWSVVSGNAEISADGLLSATGSATGTARIEVAVEGYPAVVDYLDVALVAVPVQGKLAPPNSATAVAVATPVYAVYSHPIQLLDASGVGVDNGVTASVSVSGDTLFITPSAALANETQYTVTVPAGAIADATYSSLVVDEALSWTFTTASASYTPPDSVVVSGGSEVRLGSPLQLTAAVWKSGAPVGDDDDDYNVTWSVTAGSDKVEVSATGEVTAKEGAAVGFVTIRATVINATAYFGEKQVLVEVIPDTIASPFTPPHGATGVALDAVISLAFNQSVAVENSAAITINDVPVQSALASSSVVTLTPATPLLNDAEYTVSIPAGAIKAATSPLVNASGYTWAFRTVKPAPSEVRITGGAAVSVEGELQLTAEVLPGNAIAKEVSWSTESGAAATVDANGKVRGVSAGSVTVKAAVSGYESVYATVEVLVSKPSLQAPDGAYFVFHETFENAVEGSLLGDANGTDETGYVIGSGGNTSTISGGVLTMTSSRWKTKNMDLTGEDVTLWVKVRQAPASNTVKRFQIAIDAEGASGVGGLGNHTISALPASNAAFELLTISLTAGTSSSYIHFRTESEGSVDIEEIAIYKKGVAPDPNATVSVAEEAHYPATAGVDVPVDVRIYAVFDQPVQLAGGAGEATVGGSTATLSVSEDTLFIAPAEPLENDREYTVSVDTNVVTGMADHTAGNAPFSWSFTTVKPAPAQVTIVHHVSGADTLRLGATWQLSATVTPSNAISQTLQWSVVSGNAEISASGLLSAAGSATGTARIAVAVEGYPAVVDYLDVTLVAVPVHSKLAPPSSATAVAVATPVYAVYSHPIQLLDASGVGVDNGVAASVSVSGDTLFITPSAALANETQYTVTVPAGAIADATYSSLVVDEALSWTFTTASASYTPPDSVVVSGGSEVRLGSPLQLTAAVWKSGAPVGDDDDDYNVTWSVTAGSDKVEVSATGEVTAKEGAAVGFVTIRATVINATAYFGEKQVEVIADINPDINPDTIANPFTPPHGATGVALDAVISLAFNQSVAVENSAAITINDVPAQNVLASNSVVTLTPATPLLNDAEYTVSIPAGAIKSATSPLVNASGYTWTFRTVKPAPPTAVAQTGVAAVKLYPNPAATTLNVVNSGDYTTAQIVNTTGSVLYTCSIAAGNNSVNVGLLSPGIYFVKLSAANGKSCTVKLIVGREF